MPRHLKQAIANSSQCIGKLGVSVQFRKTWPYSVNRDRISAWTLLDDGHKYNMQLWKGLRNSYLLTHVCFCCTRVWMNGVWSADLPAWPGDHPLSARGLCCFSIQWMSQLYLESPCPSSFPLRAGMGCFHSEKKLREKPGDSLPQFPSYPQKL